LNLEYLSKLSSSQVSKPVIMDNYEDPDIIMPKPGSKIELKIIANQIKDFPVL